MTAEQQEIIRGMSRIELEDLQQRGVDLPAEARLRLWKWDREGSPDAQIPADRHASAMGYHKR